MTSDNAGPEVNDPHHGKNPDLQPSMFDPQYPLDALGLKILAHWRKYRPRMCKKLEANGELLKTVYATRERAADIKSELIQQGWQVYRADEVARQDWQFPPEPEYFDDLEKLEEEDETD